MNRRPTRHSVNKAVPSRGKREEWWRWKRWQKGSKITGTHARLLLGLTLLFVLLLLLARIVRIVLIQRRQTIPIPTDDARGVPREGALSVRPGFGSRRRANEAQATLRPRRKEAAQPKKRWWRKAESWLLLVEGAVVLFVLTAGTSVWMSLQELNETYRTLHQAGPQLLPTLEAAANPNLAAVVLPPAEEYPAVARLLPVTGAMAAPALPTPPPTVTPVAAEGSPIAAASPALTPTPLPDYAQWIEIPTIGVDSPVYQSSDPWALKFGVVQFGYMTAPGQQGNLVLAAHNDSYGEIFRYLKELEQGDEIKLTGRHTTYSYRVRDSVVVEPDDVWVTLPTPHSTLTLITCHPYLIDTHRLIVFADLVQ